MEDDLLSFGTIEVYYVVWERPDAAYYLKDMTSDLGHVEWTKNKHTALYFFTEKEAKKHVKYFGKSRSGVGFESDDRDIINDLDFDDLP